ncbi:MAG TPA: hypothetical protein VFG50_12430 [Rhodothermales bacterium]|nr:hypothetical protein [Rhodothermales bacterium]
MAYGVATPEATTDTAAERPARQAYQILHIAFIIAPIIAGLDKFFNILVDWSQYLAPFIGDIISPAIFMSIVGVVEIVAGIGVAVKPRIFSYVVAAWLLGIIINLLILGDYYDIALRDLGLFLGALALARLSGVYGPR